MQADAAGPVEPVRARADADATPAAELVELRDLDQPAIGRGMDVGGQRFIPAARCSLLATSGFRGMTGVIAELQML